MKFKILLENILTEASKEDLLVNKLGISPYNAKELYKLCGSLSLIIGNKLIQKLLKEWKTRHNVNKEIKLGSDDYFDFIKILNNNNFVLSNSNKLTSIMDWIRVGLNGNIGENKNIPFDELYDKSKEWHDSLQIGDSKIDYVEKKPIILDFRENDLGFYWVDLETNNCSEEGERMGHCARSAGNLFSLREIKKLDEKHTLNKSHLTLSLGNVGYLLQLKGVKNSKPKSEYHKFIFPLFKLKNGDGSFFIKGFKNEYNTANDFKITDLNDEYLKLLLQTRPDLMTSFLIKKELHKRKLIDQSELPKFVFKLSLDTDGIDDLIESSSYRKGLVKSILSGDTWDFWENYDNDSWKSALKYNIDIANKNIIWGMLEKSDPNAKENFDNDLVSAINELDDNGEIINSLNNAVNDAEADDYYNHLYKSLKNALEEIGDVTELNDVGCEIIVDLSNFDFINDTELLEEFLETCDDDLECVFNEAIYNGNIDRPKLNLDSRWYPNVNKDYFNNVLNDRLNEI